MQTYAPVAKEAATYSNYWKPEKAVFESRYDAGLQLGKRLIEMYSGQLNDCICLGCIRGGLMVAKGVADVLGEQGISCELDFVNIRKLGKPDDKDYGIGALEEDGTPLYMEDVVEQNKVDVKCEEMKKQIEYELNEQKLRNQLFRQEKPRPKLVNLTIIIVDECIVSGATMSAAVRTIQKMINSANTRIVVASPLATLKAQKRIMDKTQLSEKDICIVEVPTVPQGFYWNTNDYYAHHQKATDKDVLEILNPEMDSVLLEERIKTVRNIS